MNFINFESEKYCDEFSLRFRLILGVKAAEDRNSILEPSMIALEFKTLFANNDITVTTNWRIDSGWQQEEELDTDWIDAKGSKLNNKV